MRENFEFSGMGEVKELTYEECEFSPNESDFLHKSIFEFLTWLDSTHIAAAFVDAFRSPLLSPYFTLSLVYSVYFKLNKIQKQGVLY